MDVLDGATKLDPDMNEEVQRWIETAKHKKDKRPVPDELPPSHDAVERSASTQLPTNGSSPSKRLTSENANLDADRNTFEESFTAALLRSPVTYDGHFDHDNDYDDQTPLLNSYYKTSHSPQQPARQTPRRAPLAPPDKAKPSRSISLWNEVSHNSQYTRPATEILREVLEVRYPVAPTPAGYEQLREAQESPALADANETQGKRRWWKKLLRTRASTRWSPPR